MMKSTEKFPSDLSWQVTQTTIYCPIVDFRVAVMVKNDWTSYCCWHEEHKNNSLNKKVNKCEGSECSYVINYRDKIAREELDKGN